ncbi:MAG: hypothetical protein DRJ38_00480 [Thermoprotei archaeon]|nr:MAG: hypothetical protein DRJ38_00480 [Thermoprotei archaeon]
MISNDCDKMKRRYAEVTITPRVISEKELNKIIDTAIFLGFKVLGINVHARDFKSISIVKNKIEQSGLDFVSRIDVTISDINSIKKYLRKYRRKVELISLRGISRKLIAFGCRDRRIDIIQVDPRYKFTLFKGDVRLILEQDKVLELTAKPLIYANSKAEWIRTLQLYDKILKIISRKNIKFIFGSGASTFTEMRDARSLASILVSFFNIEYDRALDSLSNNIHKIIERNRFKLSPRFIWPGVYLAEDQNAGKL